MMPEAQVRWTVDYRRDEWHEWERDPLPYKTTAQIRAHWAAPLAAGNARIVKLVTTEEVVK